MLYELRRFHKLSISTENKVVHNTLRLHCVVFNYGGETKFQILFKILMFLVHGKKRKEVIPVVLRKMLGTRYGPVGTRFL